MSRGPSDDALEIVRCADGLEGVARAAADAIAASARAAVARRGRFVIALSGGSTPWRMLGELARLELPWDRVHLLQVDERAAPDDHPDRNWTHVRETLVQHVPIPADNLYPMPVAGTLAGDVGPEASASAYAETLRQVCAGEQAVVDVVQLGLGGDGHTASLVPGDVALDETERDVCWTVRAYQGRRRMTLTFPVLDRARERLWLVAGSGKAAVTARLVAGDRTIPAGRVSRAPRTRVFVDDEAAGDAAG